MLGRRSGRHTNWVCTGRTYNRGHGCITENVRLRNGTCHFDCCCPYFHPDCFYQLDFSTTPICLSRIFPGAINKPWGRPVTSDELISRFSNQSQDCRRRRRSTRGRCPSPLWWRSLLHASCPSTEILSLR